MNADDIVTLLAEHGPSTGAELVERTRAEPLALWRACRRDERIVSGRVGRRYLRLDRRVEGYSRLSPSIRREFLTYTVLGLAEQADQVAARVSELTEDAARISRAKSHLARETMADVLGELRLPPDVAEGVTFIMAGDVAYDMAHSVPRPEHSTDRLVQGSDLDVIVVVADDVPEPVMKALDAAIYRKKHLLISQPQFREELDYIIKRVEKVREQLAFDTFEHMIASKILDEGMLLCGSRSLFEQVKGLVEEYGVRAKIAALQDEATRDRGVSEEHLLAVAEDTRSGAHFNLFYTSEEGDEIY